MKFNNILAICLLGSAFRLLYAAIYSPWNLSPDQFAWEMTLDESFRNGHLSYDQLIHFPHEGGTIFVSMMSLIIKCFTSFNSLTVSAFIIDFLSRFLQLYIVKKIFKPQISFAFGVWTIFALPSLIPWATVNFGLHSIASFFPFLLLYLLWKDKDTKPQFVLNGLFLGLAVWFSYDNVVLIPVYFLYLLLRRKQGIQWLYSLGSLGLVLLLHVIVRSYADAGFHLESYSALSVRGTSFSLSDPATYENVLAVWVNQLPGSTLLGLNPIIPYETLRIVWLITVLGGFLGFIVSNLRNAIPPWVAVSFWTIVFFITLYSISPFFYDETHTKNFIAYRHFSYILPFLSLYAIVGLNAFRWKHVLVIVFLACCCDGSWHLFTPPKPAQRLPIKESGWVLSAKFGHDTERLNRIVQASPYDQGELSMGIGWGLSTILFEGATQADGEKITPKVDLLVKLIDGFPQERRAKLIEGIRFAFEGTVTPKLDISIMNKVLERIVKKEGS